MCTLPVITVDKKKLIIPIKEQTDWLNESQFEEIFDMYWKRLLSFCLFHISDKENAMEIVQEVFCSLWERRASLHIKVNIGHYLFRAVRMQIALYYRTQGIRDKHNEIRKITFTESHNTTEEAVYYNELNKFVNDRIELLPARCQEIYCLSRNKGMTIPEIAHLLSISEKTVEAHLTKALRFLRNQVNMFTSL